jgi:hypothetical protein
MTVTSSAPAVGGTLELETTAVLGVRQIFYLVLNSNREEKIQLMTNDRSA